MTAPDIVKHQVVRFEERRSAYCSGRYNEPRLWRELLDPFFEAWVEAVPLSQPSRLYNLWAIDLQPVKEMNSESRFSKTGPDGACPIDGLCFQTSD